MSNKARLVLINGPAGSGKSWLYKNLATYLNKHGVLAPQVQFKGPLIKATANLLGINPEHAAFDYDRFKVTDFYGLTGRQWMIKIATSAREQDDDIFVKQAIQDVLNKRGGAAKIFICDDLGFENELNIPLAHPDIDSLVVSIAPTDGVGPSEQYPNDSRFNLCHRANIKAVNSDTALTLTINALVRRGWVVF